MSTTRLNEAMREADLSLGDLRDSLPDAQFAELVERVGRLLISAAERQRDLGVQTCRQRAHLWRTTAAASSGPATAQEEARARANEAEYLADLFAESRAATLGE